MHHYTEFVSFKIEKLPDNIHGISGLISSASDMTMEPPCGEDQNIIVTPRSGEILKGGVVSFQVDLSHTGQLEQDKRPICVEAMKQILNALNVTYTYI